MIQNVRDIQPYVWLIEHFDNVNVDEDKEFQSVYRQFWRLNAAHLSSEFCNAYFTLLEELKATDNISVGLVARQLYEMPTHNDGRRSLQFSFASKLVHMHRHDMPLCDSLLEDFFFMPGGSASENIDTKLNRKLAGYRFLISEYDRILRHKILAEAIKNFCQRFDLGAEYSDVKVIDTLIWRVVRFLRKGAIRDGLVIYGYSAQSPPIRFPINPGLQWLPLKFRKRILA